MYKDKAKNEQALSLRASGKSIKYIAKEVNISTSTASLWCRKVELTSEQKAFLSLKGQNHDLLRSYALKRHEEKVKRNEIIFNKSFGDIKELNKNEFFIAGLALYWAEGFKSKTEQTIGFCNSDPAMIKFMIKWFKEFFNLTNTAFILRVEFNSAHKERVGEIENYWSEVANIPLSQFNKPYLQKALHKRTYVNKSSYFGLLRIRLRKSSSSLVMMRGWLKGLSIISTL